jgi:hypothetical protein
MPSRRLPIPTFALLALTLLAGVTAATAAPRTCRDALLAKPTKQYSCDAAYAYTETGPPYFQGTASLQVEFDEASPPDPAVFVMRSLSNGTETYCACDSQGSASKPRFLSSMSFTCQTSSNIFRGDVTGRNGDRIRNYRIDEIKPQSQGGSELNIGGCVRTR